MASQPRYLISRAIFDGFLSPTSPERHALLVQPIFSTKSPSASKIQTEDYIHHVLLDDTTNSWRYEDRPLTTKPEKLWGFQRKEIIGEVTQEKLSVVRMICLSVPEPGRQVSGCWAGMPEKPLIDCREWIAVVIGVLRESNAGVLVDESKWGDKMVGGWMERLRGVVGLL